MEQRKCPCCSKLIPSDSVVCPECGHIMTNEEMQITAEETTQMSSQPTTPPPYYGQQQYQQQYPPQYPYQQQYQQPAKKNNTLLTVLWIIIGLLVIGLIAIFLMRMNDQSKENETMAQKADSLARLNEEIQKQNEALENENAARIAKEEAIAEEKRRKEARKRNAYNALRKIVNDASSSYEYTDDLGFDCWKVGEKYYIHDINSDGIPEVFVYYNKYYYSDLPNETILDCYWYNPGKGKAECIYNRLNKSNPSYKGSTAYTYGNGSYDKISSLSSGKFSVKKDIYDGYPDGDTYMTEYSIYDLGPLRSAFGQ